MIWSTFIWRRSPTPSSRASTTRLLPTLCACPSSAHPWDPPWDGRPGFQSPTSPFRSASAFVHAGITTCPSRDHFKYLLPVPFLACLYTIDLNLSLICIGLLHGRHLRASWLGKSLIGCRYMHRTGFLNPSTTRSIARIFKDGFVSCLVAQPLPLVHPAPK